MTPRRLGQRPEDKGDIRVDAVGTEARCFAHRFLDAVADDSQKAMNRVAPDVRRKAYVGWLGHTNARCKVLGWSKQELVDRANAMAREDYLLRETPSLTPRAVGFMGLKKVQNLRVEKPPPKHSRGGPPPGRRKQSRKPRR